MGKIIKWFDDLFFILTNILFSLIPILMILGGGLAILSILMNWFFNKEIILSEFWYIILALLIVAMGFKWDDVAIEHYPTAIERKKNSTKHKQRQ